MYLLACVRFMYLLSCVHIIHGVYILVVCRCVYVLGSIGLCTLTCRGSVRVVVYTCWIVYVSW